MKKFKNIIALGIVSSLGLTSNIYAIDKEIDNDVDYNNDSISINKKLSDVRTEISVNMLKNKLSDVKLEHLRKQKEIENVKNQLEYGTNSNTKLKTSENKRENIKRDFDEELSQEDVLIENKNWKQNVGFIYKDDINLDQDNDSNSSQSKSNTPVSSLQKMLMKTLKKCYQK